MKALRIFFISISFLISFPLLAQYTKVILDDQAGLITPTAKNFLIQKLNSNGLVLDEFLDYENRCTYLFFTITSVNNEIFISARDCEKVEKGNTTFDSDLKLASEESIGKAVGTEMIRIAELSSAQVKPQDPSQVYTNHHDTRYYFAPSAYNLKKGQLYYNTLYFLVHDVQYGVNDNFSFGLGTTVGFFPAYLSPKISKQVAPKLSLVAGDLFVFGTYATDFYVNLVYGGVTYGNRNRNITISGGLLNSNQFTRTRGLINVSSMLSASPFLYFVTENYFASIGFDVDAERIVDYEFQNSGFVSPIYEYKSFEGNQTIVGGFSGVRIISKKRDVQSFQFGFIYAIPLFTKYPEQLSTGNWTYNDGSLNRNLIIPGISYTLKFGKVY